MGELNRINSGLPTGRQGAVYPQPQRPYKAKSYSTFWRYCNAARSSARLAAQHGEQAVYARFGGGGKSDSPKRVGALGMMDDTPVPTLFLIDEVNRIPLGQATLHLLRESVSKVVLGWDLSWDEPSAATAIRTYIHANTPKAIPADLDALHPELKWIMCKLSRLLIDNLSGHHARHTEDTLMDAGTDVDFTGSGRPRDKAPMERLIGIFLDMLFKELAGATYDIPRAREFGFDSKTMIMVPLAKARELLLRAVCTYHLTPHSGLMKKQPALVFFQHAARKKIVIVDDMDELRRAAGDVDYDEKLYPSGVWRHGLRYSDSRLTRDLVDDLVALQPPSKSRTKTISLTVKVKSSPDDLGEIQVWNERTKRYVTLPCVDQEYARGMPLWAHLRVLEFAKKEALAYSSTEELIEVRKCLFEAVRNISPEAAEHDRRTLAKLQDNPLFRRVVGDFVEVVDEELVYPADELPSYFVETRLAAEHRKDATVPTPRPSPKSKASSRKAKSTPVPRDPRDAGKLKKSGTSKTVVKSTRTSSATSKLKWGTSYD